MLLGLPVLNAIGAFKIDATSGQLVFSAARIQRSGYATNHTRLEAERPMASGQRTACRVVRLMETDSESVSPQPPPQVPRKLTPYLEAISPNSNSKNARGFSSGV